MELYEKIKNMNSSKSKINLDEDLDNEVTSLEQKYEVMVSNWEEYSSQAQSRIDELKNQIDTKKKEYNYKYEKVNELKKEIDDSKNKITLKDEVAKFLNDEYQKIPVDINRNKFISKISDLTQNIVHEKNNIISFTHDLNTAESQINTFNENIKRVDNELEDKLFQNAKTTPAIKEFYTLYMKIREGYNLIQKNILESQHLKNKSKDIENKLEDQSLKIKSYDLNQLKEQVNSLKKENI